MQAEASSPTRDQPIYRICLTGGPCGGKTTVLSHLRETLAEKGFKVFVVPEVPTLTMEGGGMIIMEGLTQEKVFHFQSLLMTAQMNLEDYFYQLAKLSGKRSVILFDRGVMDPRAYMDDECWQAVLDQNNWNAVYLRDQRYNMVIHMVTAADGADTFYTLENNQARYETKDQAIGVDRNLQKAWQGHPHQVIIDNSGDGFKQKIDRAVNAVFKFIGIPVTKDLFKKFLVESFEFPADFKYEVFDVEEVYLQPSPDSESEYIRKRGINNAFSYAYTQRKKSEDPTKRSELKSNITAREYFQLLQRKQPDLDMLKKKRYTFIYEKQSLVLETVVGKNVTTLRFEASESHSEPKIPSFIKITCDVTTDKAFTSIELARKASKGIEA